MKVLHVPMLDPESIAAQVYTHLFKNTGLRKKTNDLARVIFRSYGYHVSEGYRFDISGVPRVWDAWHAAVAAMKELKTTKP